MKCYSLMIVSVKVTKMPVLCYILVYIFIILVVLNEGIN